jgi:short-subunit dehydrogenase
MGPYNTSKFGFEGFSESLRRELMIFGIDVIVVAPGAVATPIWEKADQIDTTRYDNTPYAAAMATIKKYMLELGRGGLPPEKIGKTVWRALTLKHPKVHYTVSPSGFQDFLTGSLPKRTVDNIIAGRLGLKKSG